MLIRGRMLQDTGTRNHLRHSKKPHGLLHQRHDFIKPDLIKPKNLQPSPIFKNSLTAFKNGFSLFNKRIHTLFLILRGKEQLERLTLQHQSSIQ